MALPRAKEPRRFYRAAACRYEEAQFLLKAGYTTAAVYLAGYAVECMLKALILSTEPAAKHAVTLASFRGSYAHAFDWLRQCLGDRRVHLPASVMRELAGVNWWTTNLRYDPGVLKRPDAELFLRAANDVMVWVKGRC